MQLARRVDATPRRMGVDATPSSPRLMSVHLMLAKLPATRASLSLHGDEASPLRVRASTAWIRLKHPARSSPPCKSRLIKLPNGNACTASAPCPRPATVFSAYRSSMRKQTISGRAGVGRPPTTLRWMVDATFQVAEAAKAGTQPSRTLLPRRPVAALFRHAATALRRTRGRGSLPPVLTFSAAHDKRIPPASLRRGKSQSRSRPDEKHGPRYVRRGSWLRRSTW